MEQRVLCWRAAASSIESAESKTDTMLARGASIFLARRGPSVPYVCSQIVPKPFLSAHQVRAKSILDNEGLSYQERDVAQTKLSHRPGDLARAASRLGEANINIDYAYCGVDPVASELEEIVENIRTGDAICTKRQVVDVVDRPQDIEDEDAMSFFGGDEGDADLSQG